MPPRSPSSRSAPYGDEPQQSPGLTTVITNAVGMLRRAIMRGDLRPGQKLVEADLCRTMGVSRASLREALRTLQMARLVELVPNRGPSVAALGPKEIEEIHDVWAMLTSEAVARFAAIASPHDLAAARASLARFEEALADEDPLRQLAATNALFGLVLARCGNRVLEEVVLGLVSRLNFLRAQALRYEGWGALCAHELRDVLTAIEAGAPEVARAATRRHIDSACAAAKQTALLAMPAGTRRGPTDAAPPASATQRLTTRRRRTAPRGTPAARRGPLRGRARTA